MSAAGSGAGQLWDGFAGHECLFRAVAPFVQASHWCCCDELSSCCCVSCSNVEELQAEVDKLTERAAHVRRMAVVDERVREAGLVELVRQLVHKHMDLTFMLQKEQVGCVGAQRGCWVCAWCGGGTPCRAG